MSEKMPMTRKKQLSPMQQAELERTFYSEFRQRMKAGQPAPFAGMMAARAQLIARGRIIDEWPRIGEV